LAATAEGYRAGGSPATFESCKDFPLNQSEEDVGDYDFESSQDCHPNRFSGFSSSQKRRLTFLG
jgi:hypothetical protein